MSNIVTQHDSSKVIAAIDFTYEAAKKVAELIHEENNQNLKLRAFITGGGCSGFQYGFTFDEEQKDSDIVITQKVIIEIKEKQQNVQVALLVDCMSFQYLIGAKIDYKEDLGGSRFIVHNPNATTTCGCGSSFSINEEPISE